MLLRVEFDNISVSIDLLNTTLEPLFVSTEQPHASVIEELGILSKPFENPKIVLSTVSRTWPTLLAMSSDGKDDPRIAEIRSLEQKVISSYSHVNSLADILKHLRVRTT